MEIPRDKVFWYSVEQIRLLYPTLEVKFGTKAVFRAARELANHFKYAEKKKGQEWVLGNFDEHISDYIMELEEQAYATEDYLRSTQEHAVRDAEQS